MISLNLNLNTYQSQSQSFMLEHSLGFVGSSLLTGWMAVGNLFHADDDFEFDYNFDLTLSDTYLLYNIYYTTGGQLHLSHKPRKLLSLALSQVSEY